MSNAAAHSPATVNLNGQDFILMPLNWRQLTECRDDIVVINNMSANQGMFTEEQQKSILHVITASLKRKRPDITEEFVMEHLDLGNVTEMLKGVFGRPVAPKPGEAVAAASSS